MSATGPQKSQTDQQSTQTTVQGGSGSGSTITGVSGNVTQNDPAIALAALSGVADIVKTVLAGQTNLTASVAQQGAQQQSASQDTIAQVLAAQQAEAAYQGTAGGLQTSDNTKYLIYGGIGIAALAVLAIIVGAFRKPA